MHITIDGYFGDPLKLADPKLISGFLGNYPQDIGMTPISPVQVWFYNGGDDPDKWGYSAFVLIAESHIVIHTFVEYGEAWVDIFTCKEFNGDLAIDQIRALFGFEAIEVDNGRERGIIGKHGRSPNLSAVKQARRTLADREWPHSAPEALPLFFAERTAAAMAIDSRS